jgi:hypothetical protein
VADAVTLSGTSSPAPSSTSRSAAAPTSKVARPLDHLAFRAKFDLALESEPRERPLQLIKKPIAVDETPLRIQGRVGSSLFGRRARRRRARRVDRNLSARDRPACADRPGARQ